TAVTVAAVAAAAAALALAAVTAVATAARAAVTAVTAEAAAAATRVLAPTLDDRLAAGLAGAGDAGQCFVTRADHRGLGAATGPVGHPLDHAALVVGDQRDDDTGRPGARRAARAVEVVLVVGRRV